MDLSSEIEMDPKVPGSIPGRFKMRILIALRGLDLQSHQPKSDIRDIMGLHYFRHGLVAQWITRLPTEQKIPGSIPGELEMRIFKKMKK